MLNFRKRLEQVFQKPKTIMMNALFLHQHLFVDSFNTNNFVTVLF